MFHWICPECGREIPPSVRECQACDPKAAVEPVYAAPISEAAPIVKAVEAEPQVIPGPPLAVESKVEPFAAILKAANLVEPAPTIEAPQPAPVERALPSIEPIACEPITPVEPAVAIAPVLDVDAREAAAADPAVVASETAPPVEAPVSALIDPVLPDDHSTAAPTPLLAIEAPEPATVAEPEPLDAPAPVEHAVAAEVPLAPLSNEAQERAAIAAPAVEPPVGANETVPPVEPEVETIAEHSVAAAFVLDPPATIQTPAPIEPPAAPVEVASVIPGPAVAVAATIPDAILEAPIRLHDVPDPLLALAEEIRAAQAARAAALAAQVPPSGLLELSEAVNVQETVDPASVTQKFPVTHTTAPTAEAPSRIKPMESIALLAPPEREELQFHELRPVALVPEPVAEPSPQPHPIAPAPEPEPEEWPMLPFAPMQEYRAATSRSMQPVPPKMQILATDSGPRITLPGPTLPPELSRLQDATVFTVRGEAKGGRAREAIEPPKSARTVSMLRSVLVMMLLLTVALGIVFYLMPHTVADAKPSPAPATVATAPSPSGGSSPLSKFIEITGYRIVTSTVDAAKKSEVQYLIVNHSDANISNANVFVTLRGVKAGQPPLCRFSFKVPSLGPFESKEMSSPIGSSTRAVSLPDWQEIRAEVQISQ